MGEKGMIKRMLMIVVAFMCATSFAEMARVEIIDKDKKMTVKNVELTKNEDGSLRFKFAKEDIPAGTHEINVIADIMCANKGDKGFWLFPRGEMGQFTQDNGNFQMLGHLVMPIYAMQSPKGTYMAYIKTLRFELMMVANAKDGK